ncbi:MAG: dual specificity protein phosphatase family protein [Simkaniaceae bacterium]|nr:MAG: dual specificity protein phosphatase family protein [Simkaniaceae bacterium]
MESGKPINPIPTSYNWHFENLYKSPLVRTACVLTVSIYALSRFSWTQGFFAAFPWKSTLVLIGIATVLIAKSEKALSIACKFIHVTGMNRLIFEILLIKNVLKNRFGQWEWTTEIEEGVYLSALPLREMGFKEWIIQNNIAVLAVVDPFEIQTTTLIGRAIDYKGIDHKIIFSSDFLALTLEKLHEAADWIDEKRKKGTTVLIHCKSGVGRSGSSLGAYYVLKKGKSATDARNTIVAKRPMIYKAGSNHDLQIKALEGEASK